MTLPSIKLTGFGIVALGILHMVVLGLDALNYLPGWLAGGLWTWEHWLPVVDQQEALVLQGFAFWSTLGSFAVPLVILGCLIISLNDKGVPIPSFVGIGLLAWGVVSALIMPPSGFPIFVVVAAALCYTQAKGQGTDGKRGSGA